ncbi:alpha/beta hydrolase [Pseudaminobacter soli (ex Li et al. 2025)]|nr:alpha/beta fold hydrolase [Mesorhizobium soli]
MASADSAETGVEAPGPQGPLKGTLHAAAASNAPVVLIIPGSGPTDRDGNSRLGVQASSYRLLAEGLGRRGISSVRIDKRGMFGSATAISDANNVTIGDYADDVHAWISSIRQKTGSDCVWVLGHSEGGLVALAAAARDETGICGLLLVAAAGRPLGEVLREQLRANPANAPILDQALSAIAQLEAGKPVDASKLNPALLPLFHPSVQRFLMNALSYDPAQLLAKIRKPVLILQGQRDIQVSEEDARRLAEANPKAELRVLPDVNHVLKEVTSDDRAANIATYADPNLPLAPGVVDAITEFVLAGANPN